MAEAGRASRRVDALGDNPVARVENGAGSSAIVLICEHASNRLPQRYGTLGLGADDLESHIAWDPGALGVSRWLSRTLDAPLVHATISRLVLDLNREPSASDSIPTVSERTMVPGNRAVDPAERAFRIETVYEPFHQAINALIEERIRKAGARAVISVHSFTPVYRDRARPWHVGLIFAEDQSLARPVGAGLASEPGVVVGMNEPYSPADRVFHTLERHAEARGLAPLMIEIRNDLIRHPDQQRGWAERLAPLLREAVQGV